MYQMGLAPWYITTSCARWRCNFAEAGLVQILGQEEQTPGLGGQSQPGRIIKDTISKKIYENKKEDLTTEEKLDQ